MNPDPKLPALEGMSAGQARVGLKVATWAGLNLPRAAALLVAHRQRPLRASERAELDQALARLNESLLTVKATSPAKPAGQPVAMARLAPLLRTIGRDAADLQAAGQARRSAAQAGDPQFSNHPATMSAYQRRSRAAEAAAGNPMYRTDRSAGR